MLLRHLIARALSRARVRAGSNTEMSNAMIPMTTNNSTSVKACCRFMTTSARDMRDRTVSRIGFSQLHEDEYEETAQGCLAALRNTFTELRRSANSQIDPVFSDQSRLRPRCRAPSGTRACAARVIVGRARHGQRPPGIGRGRSRVGSIRA